MSDDDETIVRERLVRLFGGRGLWPGWRGDDLTDDVPWRHDDGPPFPTARVAATGVNAAQAASSAPGPAADERSAVLADGLQAVPMDGLPAVPMDRRPAVPVDGRLAVPEAGERRVAGDGAEEPVSERRAAGDGGEEPVGEQRLPGDGGEKPVGERWLPGPGAFDPGRRGVRALAVLAAVVVLGAAGWAWMARPRSEPVPDTAAGAAPFASVTAGPVAAGSATGAAAGELVVAVAGKVRRPGLVRLPAGARVADAIAAAGGAQPGVDVALLNLARKVADGELILVGVTPPPGAAGPAADPGTAPGGGGKVNLNTATVAQLDALPGVGPVLAQRIVEHRERSGGFRSVGDLRQVNGIGDARYEELKDLVTV